GKPSRRIWLLPQRLTPSVCLWQAEDVCMASIRVRDKTGNLFFDFRYKGKRCREQTALSDTPANRRKLEGILKKLEAEITLGTFEYANYFPDSPNAEKLAVNAGRQAAKTVTPLFSEFSDIWFAEMDIQWRRSHS